MSLATVTESRTKKNFHGQWPKSVTLLILSLGLLWFSQGFSPTTLFEPQGTGWTLWFSYAKDLIQPFAFYFFTGLGEKWLKTWRGRALVAFTIPTLLEFGQALYYPVSTGQYLAVFDLVDIVMYAIGVGLAAIVEQKVVAKILKFW